MMWYGDHKLARGTDGKYRCDYYAVNNHNKSHWFSSIKHHLQQVRTVFVMDLHEGRIFCLQSPPIWWPEVTWKYPGIFNEHIPDGYE